jgi:hypothetical protein
LESKSKEKMCDITDFYSTKTYGNQCCPLLAKVFRQIYQNILPLVEKNRP